MNGRQAIVLVPIVGKIESAAAEAVGALEARGLRVLRQPASALDWARNVLASRAWQDGAETWLWIDSNLTFAPEAALRLQAYDRPFVAGGFFDVHLRRPSFVAAKEPAPDGLIAAEAAHCGFARTDRTLFASIRERSRLPTCNGRFGESIVPYFQPMLLPRNGALNYVGTDYVLAARALQADIMPFVDPAVEVRAFDRHEYDWDDGASAGGSRR